MWRTGVKGLGMGVCRVVEGKGRILCLFPYSSSKAWGLSSSYSLPDCRQGSECRALNEGAEGHSDLTSSGAGWFPPEAPAPSLFWWCLTLEACL